MRRTQLLIASILILAPMLVSTQALSAELDRRQKAIVGMIGTTINRAGKAYFEGKYDLSAQELRKAMEQAERASGLGSPDLYEAIGGHLDKISRAHAMLELEGVSLPPFRRPERPIAGAEKSAQNDGNTPAEMDPSMISFTNQVAPILVGKCGRCHVTGARGGFSAANYAALMKGPPEGVVVFAGDAIGSRLVESIETGDMPRGGARVSPDELKTLKDWILQGAKFDGTDPGQALTAVAGTPEPAPMMDVTSPKITQATGRETVSFSLDVAPLLVDNCGGCHIDAMQVRGGLRMDTFAQMLRGGDTGAIVTPGRGEASLLVKKLRGTATDGDRMPAGGRPPLADDSIALISKWIDEGATIDADERQPVKVISKLAWASQATSAELTAKRGELADDNLKLANSSVQPAETVTEHFRVVGTSSQATLDLVGQIAEKQLKLAKSVARPAGGKAAEDYFRGRATLFVLPRRYDYSEFSKMVEQRSVPSSWSSHWQFDGIDAYVATVATENDEEEDLETRLISPVISLAVATRGTDVPRWFAEGLGSAMALQQNAKSREEQEKLRTLAAEAASSVKNAKAFLENRLTPEQADSFGTAVAMSMMDRSRRKALDATMRQLDQGKSFDEAFVSGFRVTPTVYIDQLLQYAR